MLFGECSLPKFYFCRLDQCFGSGSGWIRVFSPIRIQTLINPDPSVFCFNLPLNYQRKLELIFNLCVILFALLLCFSTNYWGLNVLWLCFRGTWPKKNSVENAKDDIKFVYLYLQFIGFFSWIRIRIFRIGNMYLVNCDPDSGTFNFSKNL